MGDVIGALLLAALVATLAPSPPQAARGRVPGVVMVHGSGRAERAMHLRKRGILHRGSAETR